MLCEARTVPSLHVGVPGARQIVLHEEGHAVHPESGPHHLAVLGLHHATEELVRAQDGPQIDQT